MLEEKFDLKKELLENNSEKYYEEFKNNILENKNISQETKIEWLRLFSKNYALMCLSREDIKIIKNSYDILKQKTIQELKNPTQEELLYLEIIGADLSFNLNRSLIVEPPRSKFPLFLNYILNKCR